MSTGKHKKHSKLTRPNLGQFGRTEIAFVGAPCGHIQGLAKKIITELSEDYNLAYIDADHKAFDNDLEQPYIDEGAKVYWLDQQRMELAVQGSGNAFDHKLAFQSVDLGLVNGNHYQADAQFIFLNTSKLKSLDKRVDQLTNVLGVIRVDCDTPGEKVREALPDWADLPIYDQNDVSGIIEAVRSHVETRKPPMNALLLVGGKSSRMGRDKASLTYRSKPQYEVMQELVRPYVNETWLSVRPGQEIQSDLPELTDQFEGLGPLGAILTAFQKYPNHAWLVLACDLPFLDQSVIEELIDNRSVKHVATAFQNEESGFAEPLITIWEPKSYNRLLSFLGLGYSCPRKVLINSDTHLITPSNSEKLKNVNTPEEYEAALQKINVNG